MKSKNIEIVGFAGASVGALNAALFSCCSVKETEKIWRHIHWSKIVPFEVDKKQGKQKHLFDYFFSRKGLEEIIDEAGVANKIAHIDKPVYAVCTYLPEKSIKNVKKIIYEELDKANKMNVTGKATKQVVNKASNVGLNLRRTSKIVKPAKTFMKADLYTIATGSLLGGAIHGNIGIDVGINLFRLLLVLGLKLKKKEVIGEAKYFLCNKQPENVKDILLASSAMPIVFKDEKLDGKIEYNEEMELINEKLTGYYCDGGVKDNLPLECLIKDEKCDTNKFIVIHLDPKDRQHENQKFDGIEMIHIFPSVKFYGLLSTVNFSMGTINKLIDIGYQDAKEQLFDYFSKRDSIKNTGEIHYANGEFVSSIKDIYEAKIIEKPKEMYSKFIKSVKENKEIEQVEKENEEIVLHRKYRTKYSKFVGFGISHEELMANIVIDGKVPNCSIDFNDESNNGNIQIAICDALSLAKDLDGNTLIMNPAKNKNNEFYFGKKDRNDYFLRTTLFEAFSSKEEAKKLDKANKKSDSNMVVITPNIVVFRDENYEKLDDVYMVGVCSKSIKSVKKNKKNGHIESEDIIKQSIREFLVAASNLKYDNVLMDKWATNESDYELETVIACLYEVLVVEKYGNLFEKVIFNFEDNYEYIATFIKYFRKSITKEQLVEFEWLRNDIDLDDEIYAFDEESDWSIFLERPFKIDDIEFSSVFQYMQFKKALVFDDKYIANTILKTKDREKMREYIKKEIFSENKNENYWKAIKYATMIEALKIQMENYPELIEKLKQTGNSTIVFCTKNENKYGIIADVGDESIYNKKKWKGNNQLGYALMNIRQDLKQ